MNGPLSPRPPASLLLAAACPLSIALALAGCGDDAITSVSDSDGGGGSQTTVGTTSSSTGGATETGGTEDPGGTQTGSESDATTGGTSAGPSTSDTTTGPGTTDGATSSPTTTGETTLGTTTGATTGATTGDTTGTTGDVNECNITCGNDEWSYVWIANSNEHTVSKLNTRTMVEEGRYRTRPDNSGSPSRTSVSIDGKAVVVANRFGGLTKIWAREEFCDDKNNDGVIQTSTGKNDVLPFDQEECIAWHNDFAAEEVTVQRPVAWTSGVYNEETCVYEDQEIWTMAGKLGDQPGRCGPSGIYIYRVSGDTGEITQETHIPENELSCLFGGNSPGFGAYGAAVDPDNHVWFYVFGQGRIARVDHETLTHEVFSGGSYGITVDTAGNVWDDIPRRFDYQTQTWSNPIGNIPGNGGSGVAEDLEGRIWSATQGGVGWVDMETMVVGDIIPLPGNQLYRGVGVDIDGYIWAVQLGGTTAYKIDPDTYELEFYDGLNQPYTYSDMAGGQLNKVICVPQ